mmetsp:Transcript_105954/g.187617  ORF Transcript_105954/g.187617 Transcript_105954/m.187617 type:complete len:326 (-) Transcript_105954:336-1313(-)
MALILKNTFYDIAEPQEKVNARRSSSAPPSWKPLDTSGDWDNGKNFPSDASTTFSDDECSSMTPASLGNSDGHDTDVFLSPQHSTADESESVTSNVQTIPSEKVMSWFEESDMSPTEMAGDFCCSDKPASEESESAASKPEQVPNGKFTLCLDDTVSSTITCRPGGPRTKLRSNARAFAPVPAINKGILDLIESAREVLQTSPDALSVKVSLGTMGGTTSLLAEVRSSSPEAATVQQTLSLLKATLLDIAAGSEATYILGYGSQPFTDTSCGFSCTVGCISALQEHSVCWDTYEHGFCKRFSSCRWCHPTPMDLMQIDVMLKETV